MSKDIAKTESPKKSAAKKRATRKSQRQMRYLAQSALLEEAGTSSLVRLAMLMTCMVVLIFVLWAALTTVDEVATTLGEVIPTERIKVVQHLEGGIVSRISVDEGDLVEADQPLVVFDDKQVRAEFEKTRAREAGLLLRAERLRAFAEGRSPNFANVPAAYNNLLEDQQQILGKQRDSLKSGRAVVLDQISQREAELRALEAQRLSFYDQAEILSQQVAMREELLLRGLTSKITYLDTKREYTRVLGERRRIDKQYNAAQQALAETRSRLIDLNNNLNQTALKEMGTVTTELAQVREALAQQQTRLRRLVLRSPVRGWVQGLKVRTIGAVVPPGGVVMEIVPKGQMLVETRILTKDRGHVSLGQTANIKVTSYDFARFGSVSGKVESISPATYLDPQNGQPYYKGLVTLDADYVGNEPGLYDIKPGMTVQADVITGKKTVLQYMLKPIYVGMNRSFRER